MEERKRRFRVHGLRIIAFCAVAFVVFGFAAAGLWNALMPAIFGLPAIGFWQAIGLILLSRILLAPLGGWGRRLKRARFVRGIGDLTPEQRERFRQAMENRCARGPTTERAC